MGDGFRDGFDERMRRELDEALEAVGTCSGPQLRRYASDEVKAQLRRVTGFSPRPEPIPDQLDDTLYVLPEQEGGRLELEPWSNPDVGAWTAIWVVDARAGIAARADFRQFESAILWGWGEKVPYEEIREWDERSWAARMESDAGDWYRALFPDDPLGDGIGPMSFGEAAALVGKGADAWYSEMPGDSAVRERLFAELARRVGCGYDAVYNAFLGDRRVRLTPRER